jgi:Glycosyl transferase family 2
MMRRAETIHKRLRDQPVARSSPRAPSSISSSLGAAPPAVLSDDATGRNSAHQRLVPRLAYRGDVTVERVKGAQPPDRVGPDEKADGLFLHWTVVAPRTGLLRGLSLGELWAYREVVVALAVRQIRVRYTQTVLGVGGVPVQPLVGLVSVHPDLRPPRGAAERWLPVPALRSDWAGSLEQHRAAAVTMATTRLVADRDSDHEGLLPRVLAPLASTLRPLIGLGVGVVITAVTAGSGRRGSRPGRSQRLGAVPRGDQDGDGGGAVPLKIPSGLASRPRWPKTTSQPSAGARHRNLAPFPKPPVALDGAAKVSVVVTNHNYGRFLPDAVDSALGQRDADVEVVVVDDGSTDESREILRRYADRVQLVLQDNQGQAAAFNAGLAVARGQIVMFLDADDVLDAHAAAKVVAAFAVQPAAARVIFRLRAVDEWGRATGELRPPTDVSLPNGDVRARVLRFADDLAWPSTSGNAFAAWALRRVMPLPVDGDPVNADMWLHPLTPLFGVVTALEQPMGVYRIHAANRHHRDRLQSDTSAAILRRSLAAHAALDRVARELGHGPARPHSVTLAVHRLSSLCLGTPEAHPLRGDSRRRALGDGLRAALGRTDLRLARRAVLGGWFLVAAVAPAPAFRLLAEFLLLPERRPRVLRNLLRR